MGGGLTCCQLKITAMNHLYSRSLRINFDDAVTKITHCLQQEGFGIITSIDLKETLNQKLGVPFRKYKILGACIPDFAYKAVSIESHLGTLLPCNVVVQEHENGEVEVSAASPLGNISKDMEVTQLTDIAAAVSNRLRAAIDALQRDSKEGRIDALPSGFHYN